LTRLRSTGSLNEEDFKALSSGYALLRSVDHQLRLILGKQARLPTIDQAALQDMAKKLGFVSAAALNQTLVESMKGIREAYDRITA